MAEIKIAREKFADVIEEAKPLLVEHWTELSLYPDIPLDPDYEVYQALEKLDQMSIYTVRARGEMVGYAVYFTRRHHHYRSATWAMSDIILVRNGHRNLGVGTALFDFVEQDLRSQGVDVIHTMTKTAHPELAMLLRARKHQEAELCFSLRL